MSLAQLREMPRKSLTLLVGPPGAGKSTFCHEVIANELATDGQIIYVATEEGPSQVLDLLRERGVERIPAGALSFVDAFGDTVGLASDGRSDTVQANCEDLNSISMAIAKLQKKIGKEDILLAFDSLTSPYLFNEKEILRFIRVGLLKFASDGNSVLAVVDEGCGREEDLGAMMSLANAIIKMEMARGLRTIDVVKHRTVEPTRITVPVGAAPTIRSVFETFRSRLALDDGQMGEFIGSMSRRGGIPVRKKMGDFVNLFWPSFAHWSCMLWDPKGFPTMIYELNKEDGTFSTSKEVRPHVPWRIRLNLRLFLSFRALGLMPRSFAKVKDMKKFGVPWGESAMWEQSGEIEYLEDVSADDEHYFRIHGSSDCWGLEKVGCALAWHLPPHMAGQLNGFDDGIDWNAIETKCIGLGDTHCEVKLIPGEENGLGPSLEKDGTIVERIHERLMERAAAYVLEGKPLTERPGLGSEVHLHPVIHGLGFPYIAVAGGRYRMALRMGGARAGKKLAERLTAEGMNGDEAVERVLGLLENCKVGQVVMDGTIRMWENCESFSTTLFMGAQEPSCFFTTGFLNGVFSVIKDRHIKESKCIAVGDPYCEWEIHG